MAVALAGEIGPGQVCKELGINYTALKKQIEQRPSIAPSSAFFEIKLPVPPTPPSRISCRLEVENARRKVGVALENVSVEELVALIRQLEVVS